MTSRTSRSLPAATGVRAPWTSVPEHLRARVLDLLGGGEVAEAVSQTGGFSPGPAVRLRTTAGRRAFVKAVSAESNPDSPGMHRREAAYSARMPEHAPVPELLGSFDEDGWVVLVFEEIEGHNPGPEWDEDELRRAVRALGEMAETLTPSPVEAPPIAERLVGLTGWRDFVKLREAGGDDLAGLDPWAAERLERLAEIEGTMIGLCGGDTLLNLDVRADTS